MKCPSCNETDHEPTAKYCHVCGTALVSVGDEHKGNGGKGGKHKGHEAPPLIPGVLKGVLVFLGIIFVIFGFSHWLSNRSRSVDTPPQREKMGSGEGETSFDDLKIAIDLGLPSGTKWASCNIGATQPWELGGYYAWGETEEKTEYREETYKHHRSFLWGLISTYRDLGNSICGTKYDVAHVKWGGKWQMPTSEQFIELMEVCKYEWTTLNGVAGGKFTGPNNNYIFLPAAGMREFDKLYSFGSYGHYWSGAQDVDHDDVAYSLDFREGGLYDCFRDEGVYWENWPRDYGLSVRPVAVHSTVHTYDYVDTASEKAWQNRRSDPYKYHYILNGDP